MCMCELVRVGGRPCYIPHQETPTAFPSPALIILRHLPKHLPHKGLRGMRSPLPRGQNAELNPPPGIRAAGTLRGCLAAANVTAAAAHKYTAVHGLAWARALTLRAK